MNIFSKLPFLKSNQDAVDDSDVETKADRIKFHAESVRNGPVNFKQPTSGQRRRAFERYQASQQKKNRRRSINQHFDLRQEAALLRARLQAARVVAVISPTYPNRQQTFDAIVWIVEHFGKPDDEGQISVTEPVVRAALTSALNRYQTILNIPVTSLPEDYALPVQFATSA